MKKGIIEKYLGEATFSDSYPDTFGIAGDDDYPPGNIVFGQKFKKVPYKNKLTGYDKVWGLDDSEWNWAEFEASKGMEDPNNYSETLKSLGDIVPDFDFYHRLKKRVPDKDVESNYNRSPQTRDPDTQLGKDDDVETADVPDDIKEKRNKIMSFRDYIIEANVTVYDNGGSTMDRYTVIIGDDVFGMSDNTTSPQGFNQWAGSISDKDIVIGSHLGKKVKTTSLPKDVQKAIKDRMKEA